MEFLDLAKIPNNKTVSLILNAVNQFHLFNDCRQAYALLVSHRRNTGWVLVLLQRRLPNITALELFRPCKLRLTPGTQTSGPNIRSFRTTSCG
jgi:hypothetical protein